MILTGPMGPIRFKLARTGSMYLLENEMQSLQSDFESLWSVFEIKTVF